MSKETHLSNSCTICGTPTHMGCEHKGAYPDTVEHLEQSGLTLERLADMQNLEIEIKTDLGPILEELRSITGEDLQPRPDGFHMTIVGPTENKILKYT